MACEINIVIKWCLLQVPDVRTGTERVDAVVIDEEAVDSADGSRVVAKILRGDCTLEHFLHELKSICQTVCCFCMLK